MQPARRCHRILKRIIARGASPSPSIAAARLIDEFGSAAASISAPRWRLLKVMHNDRAAATEILEFSRSMRSLLRREMVSRPIIGDWAALRTYLMHELGCLAIEHFRVLFLNTRQRLIRDQTMSTGSIDEAAIHVREVIKRALELGAAGIILVHNHPSGDPTPSRADIDISRAIIEAGRRLGIAVHDHLIIGIDRIVSLREERMI